MKNNGNTRANRGSAATALVAGTGLSPRMARALGVLSGLAGEPRLWRHRGAVSPVLLSAWRDGYAEASDARRRDRERAQRRALTSASRPVGALVVPVAANDPIRTILPHARVRLGDW